MMRAYWVKTKCGFESKTSFKYDGSEYLLWDAVAVAPNESGIRSKVRDSVKQNGYSLIDMTISEVDMYFYSSDEIPERVDAMRSSARDASYSAIMSGRLDDIHLDWCTWCMTERELTSYRAPNKKHLWKVAYKTKVTALSGMAMYGSEFHYNRVLVPADTAEEAQSEVQKIEQKDHAELQEILMCEICTGKLEDEWHDLFNFGEIREGEIKRLLNHGVPSKRWGITGESLKYQIEELKDRRTVGLWRCVDEQ